MFHNIEQLQQLYLLLSEKFWVIKSPGIKHG